MLRELQVTSEKPANSMFKSAEDEVVVTGMGVVRDEATKTFTFPNVETATNIYVVDKERVPKGINCAYEGYMSDYHDDFTKVVTGEFAKTLAFYAGERFAVDQFTLGALVVGNYMSIGTSGKWQKASASVKSKYIYKGEYRDANKVVMALIEVGEEGTNA